MARKPQPTGRNVYVAIESFATDIDGVPTNVNSGRTTVREGHPLLTRFPDFFRVLTPDYEWEPEERWEMATAVPGEVRA